MTELKITDDDLNHLERLARLVTPGGHGLPAADAADPNQDVLRLALKHFGATGERIVAALQGIDSSAGEEQVLEQLDARSPGLAQLAVELLTARYFSSGPVWEALGYAGRKASPPSDGEAEFFLRGEILESVRERGQVFNDAR